MVEGNRENVVVLRWLLKNFKLLSGLSVNFDKSSVFGVNIEEEELVEMANNLGCKMGTIPMQYLGMMDGDKVKRVERYKEVVERMKNKPRGFDPVSLSISGGVTIVRSILSVMPLYGKFFLPMPKAVANQFTSLQCMFLWDGKEDIKKLAWVR